MGRHLVDGFGNTCSLPADGYVERIEVNASFDSPQEIKVTVRYVYHIPTFEEVLE